MGIKMSYYVSVDLNFIVINLGSTYTSSPKFAIEMELRHWRYGDNLSNYVNLGDWIGYFTYGVFDGETFELKKIEK